MIINSENSISKITRSIMTESFRINESAGKYGKLDEGKLNKLKSTAKKYGYQFRTFEVTEYAGRIRYRIQLDRINNSSLYPHIRTAESDTRVEFLVSPAFMGELSTKDARNMAKYIDDACDLVDILNKTKWTDYVTEWEEF